MSHPLTSIELPTHPQFMHGVRRVQKPWESCRGCAVCDAFTALDGQWSRIPSLVPTIIEAVLYYVRSQSRVHMAMCESFTEYNDEPIIESYHTDMLDFAHNAGLCEPTSRAELKLMHVEALAAEDASVPGSTFRTQRRASSWYASLMKKQDACNKSQEYLYHLMIGGEQPHHNSAKEDVPLPIQATSAILYTEVINKFADRIQQTKPVPVPLDVQIKTLLSAHFSSVSSPASMTVSQSGSNVAMDC